MIYATRGGDGWLWYAIGLLMLFFGGEQGLAALLTGGLAAAAGALLFLGMKRKPAGEGRARLLSTVGQSFCHPINSHFPRAIPLLPSRLRSVSDLITRLSCRGFSSALSAWRFRESFWECTSSVMLSWAPGSE